MFPITRPTHHFLADLLMFFYCATQANFIGDHIERSKSDHFERSYEVLRPNLSKIGAKVDTFPIIEEKSHSRDNDKILHPFFAYRLRFFYCATQRVFIEDHILQKLCKSDYFERSYDVFKSKFV